MFSYLWLQGRRFAVLVPGLIVAYLATTEIFPFVHARVALAPAILITYVLAAYVLAPNLIRLWRIFSRPSRLQPYCITPDGFASDPINIGIIGSRHELILAIEAAGWHTALPATPRTMALTVNALLFNKLFHGMPMTRLYLFGRKQDIGFEKQITGKGRGHRHHVRFWATTIEDMKDIKAQIKTGTSRTHRITHGQMLWVGAASRDAGLALIRQSLQITHFVDSDTNAERDYTVRRLVKSGKATQIATIQLHQGIDLLNRAFFARLFSDGKMAILELTKSSK